MQVIFICVAEAAQNTLCAGRAVHEEPAMGGNAGGASSPIIPGTEVRSGDPGAVPNVPPRAVWNFFCGGGTLFPAAPSSEAGAHQRC